MTMNDLIARTQSEPAEVSEARKQRRRARQIERAAADRYYASIVETCMSDLTRREIAQVQRAIAAVVEVDGDA